MRTTKKEREQLASIVNSIEVSYILRENCQSKFDKGASTPEDYTKTMRVANRMYDRAIKELNEMTGTTIALRGEA